MWIRNIWFFFADFGNEFIIYDKKGEESKEYLIDSITKEKNGKVFINTKLVLKK